MSFRSSAPFRPIAAGPASLRIADKRSYPRYVLDLPGRFMRADKLDYPCRLKDISVVGAAMTTPTILTVGEKLIVYLLHLGGLEGNVVRRFEGGFAMSITATQRKREKLAGQILRLSEEKVIPETEERQHPRLPGNQISTLTLPDGTCLQCPILDLSRSGASIGIAVRPPIGTEVVLGEEPAAVVRHHEYGIGIEFINQRLEDGAVFDRYRQGGGEQSQR